MPIFPGCKYYEREVHEFFGIKFPGNPDYHKQLILEAWDDMPPLLKDFDPRAYSDKKFAKRVYTENHENLDGQAPKKPAREKRYSDIEVVRKGGKK
jgi:NADH-quinone oxidoreductase subunit C